MKITERESAVNVKKPDGTNLTYYLFDEYEIHFNELEPGCIQPWHHHETIWETIYIIEGELTLKWKDKQENSEQILHPGDVAEVEDSPHSLSNQTKELSKFIVLKQVLSGENHREIFKKDKIVD